MKASEFINEVTIPPGAVNLLKKAVGAVDKKVEPVPTATGPYTKYPNLPNPDVTLDISPEARSAMDDLASGKGAGTDLKASPEYRRDVRRNKQQQGAQQKVQDRVRAGYGEDDDVYPWLNQNENFANGKNPQDKGDSKRYHVPTKGSVSSLRKYAKGHSGRAAQLAHWMANMKSGHKK